MKNIIVITIKLLVITLIAGILLGVVNGITKEPIAAQEQKKADEARRAAFPEAAGFEESTLAISEEYAVIKSVYTALDADGSEIGMVVSIVTKGYNSGLNLTVGVGADGTVKGVAVGTHSETPGLGAKVTETEFRTQYAGKPYTQVLTVVKTEPSADNEVQAITGATITSRTVTDAVNTAAAYYTEQMGGAR